jgi:uncharacterized protein (TIGR02996 family)
MDERELFAAVARAPEDAALRMVYADWLEQAGDRRADFVRAHLELAPLPPDYPDRLVREAALAKLRVGLEASWLAVIEQERDARRGEAYNCNCFEPNARGQMRVGAFHCEPQDTECDAWKRLLDLVEQAAHDGRDVFDPLRELDGRDQIVTLPPTIAKLVAVKQLRLYGSRLVRIPPEIRHMTSLTTFTPYTSYWLHWAPYELARCPQLRSSTVSTRALYGNYKYRSPFPSLAPGTYPPVMRPCSVCDQPFRDEGAHRLWISLRCGSDVWPLLVNACSVACTQQIPAAPDNFIPGLHHGGDIAQPDPY